MTCGTGCRIRRLSLAIVLVSAMWSSCDAMVVSAVTRGLEQRILKLAEQSASSTAIENTVAELLSTGDGIANPALDPAIEGDWTLVHISSSDFDPRNPLGRRVDGTSPGLEGFLSALTGGDSVTAASSSPIQRAVTSAFAVSQNIVGLAGGSGRVEQLVRTPLGELHLNAAATVSDSRPERIDFAFDEGFFEFSGTGFRVPYPVPFRLLGKEAAGFLDTLYLSEALRISKGNKGSTFVLARND